MAKFRCFERGFYEKRECAKGLRENKRKSNPQLLFCRHTGPCERTNYRFSKTSSARVHETAHTKCGPECPVCGSDVEEVKSTPEKATKAPEAAIIKPTTEGQKRQSIKKPCQPLSRVLRSFKNSIKKRKRASASKQEVQRRRNEVMKLIPRILGCSDVQESFKVLFKNKQIQEELKQFLRDDRNIVDQLEAEKPSISTEILLGLKDRIYISDADWTYLARLFKLPNGTIYKIKKLRKQPNAQAGITAT